MQVAVASVPRQPGLYAIHADADVWEELGLALPPDPRPLYAGKAERSLAGRDINTRYTSTPWCDGRRSATRQEAIQVTTGRDELLKAAGKVAADWNHHWLGTEHVLVAYLEASARTRSSRSSPRLG